MDVVREPDRIALALEFCGAGDLAQLLRRRNGTPLPEEVGALAMPTIPTLATGRRVLTQGRVAVSECRTRPRRARDARPGPPTPTLTRPRYPASSCTRPQP